ncbi:glutamine amidotransferase [Acinetobacter sp. MD2(2019)]|uniref:glutamine amidotransferase n=1 Tax=Acinetobacter sp. MD2(2019) TaxID=2605273 RepID=UPI002D1E73DF|nr:glutamine amidotransferase [Acinetobacter sp. MD2(2019)]MEB3754071.1 glutamine amidotransferase [Acinetobacter sp. MD2(2019)]
MTTFPHHKTIYAIQHLAFEDLGSLEDVFYQLGFRIRYFEAGIDDLSPALAYDGLTILLGGPIGVYEQEDYPFLIDEIAGLKQRLAQNKPTLGICLGAQLIAHALGAKVYAGHEKEIGWSELSIAEIENNPLAALNGTAVLHWHGDTFDLPEQATLLASSSIYPNQAFAVGKQILGLQFHVEVAHDSLESWLIGNTCELRHAGIAIPQLRQDNQKYATTLEHAAQAVIHEFLKNLNL